MADTTTGPGPVAEQWEWQFEGLCRTVSPELFFHPEGERGSARRRRDERAKRLCLQCPVLEQCRSHALSAREPYGVWGAMTEEERIAILAEADITPGDHKGAAHKVTATARSAAHPAADADEPGRNTA